MALIKTVRGKTPVFGKNIWLADNCTVTGDVVCGDDCNIWFGAILRGDVHYIKIGNRVNIQDNAVIHCTYEKSPVNIGNCVSIAHNAIVHGATIKDNVLIGMNAVILDDAVIESNCIIAAGAVITKGTITEPNSVYAGIPAKKIKTVDEKLSKDNIERIVNNYAMYADWYRE